MWRSGETTASCLGRSAWAGALCLLAITSQARGAPDRKPAVVILDDGQAIEGLVTVDAAGSVEIKVRGLSGDYFKVRLDAGAIVRIDPVDKEEPKASLGSVHLIDGRTIRGEVLVRRADVLVRGSYGRVEIPQGDIEEIEWKAPTPRRVAIDADLGLSLPIPPGWEADAAGGVGERIRLVHATGRAWVSILIRHAAGRGDAAEQIRAALDDDLSSEARITPRGSSFHIEDELTDPASEGQQLKVSGPAELRGDLVVWVRSAYDASESLAPEVVNSARSLGLQRRWLGSQLASNYYRAEKLRLLVQAPSGFRVRSGESNGELARVTSRAEKDSTLQIFAFEGSDPRARLAEQCGDGAVIEASTQAGTKGFEVTGDKVRGFAYSIEGQAVVVVAKSPVPDSLTRLTWGVALIDPDSLAEEAKVASRLAAVRAQALHEDRPRAILEALAPVLEVEPDDPRSLSLRVLALRRMGSEAGLLKALDAAFVATGSAWLEHELAAVLLERAAAAPEGKDGYELAAASYQRAAEVHPAEDVLSDVVGFFLAGAKQAFGEGDLSRCWARLARARKVAGSWPKLDDSEREMRLTAAKQFLKKKNPGAARREARRAYALGADPGAVDGVYDRAEKVQEALQRAKGKRRRKSGFSFGFPPSRVGGRSRRVRATAFSRPSRSSRRIRTRSARRSRRVRRTSRTGRSKRVRTTPNRSRRVRTNGRLVFR